MCRDLALDGGNLPDDPFSDPTMADNDETPRRDVFSLGIVIYIIMTGHYPFQEGPAPVGDAHWPYEESVRQRFKEGEFPDLTNVRFGQVIKGCCCTRDYPSGVEVLAAIWAEM